MSNEQDNKMIITRAEYDEFKSEILRLRHREQVDGGDKFWLYCWAILGTVLIAFVALLTFSLYSENKLFADIIAKSPENAMQIACAQDVNSSQASPSCTIYLSRK